MYKRQPLWDEWREWNGEPTPGYFYCEDLEEAREELHKLGYLPRVKRSHKADLRRLTVTLGKSNMVIIQAPKHADEVSAFCSNLGLEYRGQGLSTCVELALQMLLKQKRRQPTHAERTETYKRQDGKCSHCACELDGCEEFDHVLPVRDATTGTEVKWRAVCRECHALLTERDATRRNPLLSSFTPHLYTPVPSRPTLSTHECLSTT